MFDKMKILKEAGRLLPFLGVAGLILIPDNSVSVVIFAIGISLLVTAVSHIVRKMLFPYLDLKTLMESSLEGNVAASIVFASVTSIIIALIFSTTMLLK